MSEGTAPEKRSRSHAVAWVLSLLAVPVLYLLSVPPLYCGITTNWGRRLPNHPPAWVMHYKEPFQWLYDHTPLQRPLDDYVLWWRRAFLKHVPTAPKPVSPP
jgi:hypothetical protein